jgi:hypothetical protein
VCQVFDFENMHWFIEERQFAFMVRCMKARSPSSPKITD